MLETFHSVLYIIPWCSQQIRYDCMEKTYHSPTTQKKNPSQNLEEGNCAWGMLLLPFFSLPSLEIFNLDAILPLPTAGWSPFC